MIDVPGLDAAAMVAARDRQSRLAKPAGSLGRLEELSVWAAGVQGACPPHPFAAPVVLVVAGDHGIARAGVSAYPPAVTAQLVGNVLAGGAAVNVLAALAGARVRVADLAVNGDTALTVARHKVRRGSGSIDRTDALSDEQVRQAYAAGRQLADDEVDAGTDLLIAGDMGIGNTTPAAVLAAVLTGSEPIAVVGRGTGVDDAGWMRKAAAVRDALRRCAPHHADPLALLRTAGGADLAASTGLLVQAAVRRTPVLLDGVVPCVCAGLAERLAPGASAWWVAGTRSTEPAQRLVLDSLGLVPLLDLGLRLGEGTGALLALPLLQAAVAILGQMETFEEAGVSDREGGA